MIWDIYPSNKDNDLGDDIENEEDNMDEDNNEENADEENADEENAEENLNDETYENREDDTFGPDQTPMDDAINDEEQSFLNLLMALGLTDPRGSVGIQSNSGHKGSAFSKIVRTEYYNGAAETFGTGTTFKEKFAHEQHAELREESNNLYYPMASFKEWEFSNILLRMPVSQNWKNELLNTQLVSFLSISHTKTSTEYF